MNADPGLDPIRVLLVDDHPLVRDGVRMRLEATPHIRVAAEAAACRRPWSSPPPWPRTSC